MDQWRLAERRNIEPTLAVGLATWKILSPSKLPLSILYVLFSAGILWHLIVYAKPEQSSFDIVLFMLVMMTSGLLGLSVNGHLVIGFGFLQRGLYLVSFVWLWYRY